MLDSRPVGGAPMTRIPEGVRGVPPRRPETVPYITAWSAERAPAPIVTGRPRVGVAYEDEDLFDRDGEGVLWTRALSRPGQGRPVFGDVHPLRQRRAMRRLLCQVCGGPADRNEQGVLWLLGDHREDWPGWPENMAATHPPVCLPCAGQSVQACPHLGRGFAAVRVRSPRVSGVYGARYHPANPFDGPVEDVVKAYGDCGIRWVVASQLAMELRDCTFVDLEAELAAAAAQER
ncbi:hypothetical protein [Streptomyces sp. NPDC059479]|uniref:hypothetical protein n=1 Tax=Streptomyces sp. NPDC059479 TaxID=3346848 RepID=UPI00367CB904